MKKSLTTMVFIISILIIIGFGFSFYSIYNKARNLESIWENYVAQIVKRSLLTSDIKSQFGYGGAIHHFKNYILRGGDKYVKRFNKSYSELKITIDEYKKIAGSGDEATQLEIIKRTFEEYKTNLKFAVALKAKGNSVEAIDRKININDGPALKAFSVLNDSFNALTNKRSAVITDTITGLQLILVGIFIGISIFLLLLSYATIIFIARPIKKTVHMINEMSLGHLDNRLNLNRRDEIGQMASAMDRFADDLQSGTVLAMQRMAEGDLYFRGGTQGRPRRDWTFPQAHLR